MEPRVLDFDRARAERRQPTVLKAFGETLTVPSSAPLGFVMLVDKLNTEKGEDYEPDFDELVEMLSHALGEDTFQKLLDSNQLELEDLEDIMALVTGKWFEEEDEGEVEAPEQGAAGSTTSENTGES